MTTGRNLLIAGLLFCLGPLAALQGEVFLLTNGGRVTGEWINRDEKLPRKYEVRLTGGGRITIPAVQVQKVLPERSELAEYEKIRPRYPDTVKGQWALAEWCRQQCLRAQRETHLQRVIELNPDHAEARRALGYKPIGGRWTTQEDVMIRRGYKLYKGRWTLPQEIELIEGKKERKAAQRDWLLKVRRWRNWLGTPREAQARRLLAGIDDPTAVKALILGLRDDNSVNARLLFAEVLAKMDTPEATRALKFAAMGDPEPEVRLTCLDHLQKKPHPSVTEYFVRKLRSKSNPTVNRAGVALGRIKDPSTIAPLIDALVTEHQFKIKTGGGTSATFGRNSSGGPGPTGLSVGGSQQIFSEKFSNQAVLDALMAITGQNFAFNQQKWKAWYAAQRQASSLDARRD